MGLDSTAAQLAQPKATFMRICIAAERRRKELANGAGTSGDP
jgi:hypothetical protein